MEYMPGVVGWEACALAVFRGSSSVDSGRGAGVLGADGRVAAPVRNGCKVRGDRIGRSEWAEPSLEERRVFVVRVVGLASGRVRVRAGGFLDLKELEEVGESSLEAL